MKMDELNKELEGKNLSGFWKTRVPVHRPEAPFLWKWKDLYDGLMKAKDTIGIDQAERRAIRLLNPNAPIKSTSRTLQFTFSIVNPGEVAKAHRHNMTAIRFVVQGRGAITTVEGEPFPMEEGDLILTPNWNWHEHTNGSKEPIIWLDGLDGPIIQNFNVLFFEDYDYEKGDYPQTSKVGESEKRLGFVRPPLISESGQSGTPFRYRWKDTYELLKSIRDDEADPYDGNLIRYVNPMTGGFTLPTMSCEGQLLLPRYKSQFHRHTSTTLYHVFRGKGHTVVGEECLKWQRGDSFTIPIWQWHRHENPFAEEAVLFSISDRPIMESLGLYRENS